MNIRTQLIFVVLALALSLTVGVAAAQDAPITLDLWTFEGGESEEDFMPTLISEFQAQHPNITVQVTAIPEGEYVTKIDTALLAGTPPDLGIIYVPRWLKSGHFLSIDDVIADQNIAVDDFNVGAMSTNCLVDGEVYCLGTYTGAVLLFYNKDMFDRVGLPYPSATEPMTIDEYADMALQLTVQSDNLEERVWGGDAGATYWWMDWRNMFSEDGRTTIGYINDEATAHTYQVIADMRGQGSAMTAGDLSMVEGLDLLSTGNLATSIIDNVVAVPQLETAGIRWGAAVPPVERAGDLPWIPMWTDGVAVFSGSDHPDEAKLFVAFLGTDGNRLRMEVSGGLPLNMRQAEELNWAGENEGRQEVLAAVQTARPVIFVPDFWTVIEPINEAFDGYMLEDGLSAQEALDEVAPIIQENLDQAWATWDQFQ
jgi:multiple sugar transport system substrate-binding protein